MGCYSQNAVFQSKWRKCVTLILRTMFKISAQSVPLGLRRVAFIADIVLFVLFFCISGICDAVVAL